MPAHPPNRLFARLPATATWCLVLLLAACTWGPSPEEQVQMATQRAQQLIAQGQPEQAAAVYWKAAQGQDTPYRQRLQLKAVEVVATQATRDQARAYLARLDETDYAGELLVRKRLLEARVALLFDRPDLALDALPPGLFSSAPQLAPQLDELRAQALALEGDLLNSVETRVRLGRYPVDEDTLRRNADAIWRTLNQAPASELERWSQEMADPEVQGWLELAHLARTAPADAQGLRTAIEAWRLRHPGHPADPDFVERIWAEWRSFQFQPSNITVFLPLTGRYATLGRSVLVGITAAHYHAGARDTAPTLRVRDVGEGGEEVEAAYRAAVAEGTEAIIGPLLKEQVARLAMLDDLEVPVLTLNNRPHEGSANPQLFEFGLAPEDEARQVAARMTQDERAMAIGFAPDSGWGTRVLEAFGGQLEEAGGRLLDGEGVEAGSADFSTPIKRALLIDQSEQRLKALKNLLRLQIEFEPRRRQDVQGVFVSTTPRQARQLRPQLAFFYAADLPVYGTSHIYSGTPDPAADADLNGTTFCDGPWIIDGDSSTQALRQEVQSLFPDAQHQYARLVALGIDAYRLLPQIKRLAAREYERFPGVTGRLWIDPEHRIHRELLWARFLDGLPQPLPSPPREGPGE